MPSKNQDLPITSPQYSEEQDRLPSIDTADLREDTSPPNSPTDIQIAAYAYQLYEEAGCPEGQAAQHWMEAKERLRRNL